MPIAVARVPKYVGYWADFCWPIFNKEDILSMINFMKMRELPGVIQKYIAPIYNFQVLIRAFYEIEQRL